MRYEFAWLRSLVELNRGCHSRLLWSRNAALGLIYLATTTPVKNFPGDFVPFDAPSPGGQANFDVGIPQCAHPGRGAA
jgi:hypothetical protein